LAPEVAFQVTKYVSDYKKWAGKLNIAAKRTLKDYSKHLERDEGKKTSTVAKMTHHIAKYIKI